MGLKVTGLDGLGIRLENVALRASEGAREALERGSQKIRVKAIDYAPVDEGNLEEAIKTESNRDGIHGRKTFSVYVDDTAPGTRANNVGQYATIMHEGVYKLGEKSQEKDAGRGVVGPKYLERALDDLEDEIKTDVQNNVNKRVGK